MFIEKLMTTTLYNQFFSIVDKTLELAPTPDTNYTLQLTYYASIQRW